jgi:hypothetical protein
MLATGSRLGLVVMAMLGARPRKVARDKRGGSRRRLGPRPWWIWWWQPCWGRNPGSQLRDKEGSHRQPGPRLGNRQLGKGVEVDGGEGEAVDGAA